MSPLNIPQDPDQLLIQDAIGFTIAWRPEGLWPHRDAQ